MPTPTSTITSAANRRRFPRVWTALAGALGLATVLVIAWLLLTGPDSIEGAVLLDRPPRITPDYAGVTIPPNIAPLNFLIRETGIRFRVLVRGAAGAPIEVESRGPKITIPATSWRELLVANKGGDLNIDIRAQTNSQQWARFATLTNRVANEDIDPVLMYRKITPTHNSWSGMGLFERDLRTFQETPVLENRRYSGGCCHCHMLRNNNPDTFIALIRSDQYDNSVLVMNNGNVEAVAGSVGFVAWHPHAPLVAAAFNKPALMLHTARNDMRDIIEDEGWIGSFGLKSKIVRKIPGLSDKARLLASPAWAPDGRHLYYCSAPNTMANKADKNVNSYTLEKYDLMRIAYDPDKDQWGRPESVLLALDTGLSIASPRISPDGRWLFACGVPYGCWPAYHSTSDLYGIDLRAGEASGKFTWRKLDLNSDACESWLSWSANSRWVVFSSKRISPLMNRPFISYISENGTCGKPFILPQHDPEFYDSLLQTYTIPALATGPISVPQRHILNAIEEPHKSVLIMPPMEQSDKAPADRP